jgi:hypothetical protein
VEVRRRRNGFVVFQFLEEIGDVEEGIPVEADVYEGRLHPGENPGDLTLVDTPHQPRFLFSLHIKFNNLVVLQQRDLGLVRRRGNNHFLRHTNS